MRFAFLFGRTFLPVLLAAAILLHPMLGVADWTQEAGTTRPAEPIQSPVPDALGAANQASGAVVVQQGVDGNIPGRVTILDAAGRPVPVRATVSFVQKGVVIAQARSDEWGRFQATGLDPGVYSVLAAGRDGFAALSAIVLGPGTSAATTGPSVLPAGRSVQAPLPLEITLIPVAEFDLLAEMLAEVIGDAGAGEPVPFAATWGSGGGGGRGLGTLLGAAGLAGGIAALATARTQASPSTP